MQGVYIKVILSKYREENIVRKSLNQYHCEMDCLELNKLLPPVKEFENTNVVGISGFRERTNHPAVPGRDEVLLHEKMPVKNRDAVRNIFIGKYKETIRSAVYTKSIHTVEIKV